MKYFYISFSLQNLVCTFQPFKLSAQQPRASVLDRAALEKGGLSWRRYARSLLPALLSPLHPHLWVISTPHLVSATITKLRALSYLQTPNLPTAV